MSESTLKITASQLPRHGTGALSFQLYDVNATGAVTYSIVAGSLPSGATLSTAGLLSWPSPVVGTYAFTIQAQDSVTTDTLVATLTVYGASFGTITLASIPQDFIDAVDLVLSLVATNDQVRRHFARSPNFPTEDWAHFASDIAADPDGGTSYQDLSTVIQSLAQHPIAIIGEFSVAAFDSVSGDPEIGTIRFGTDSDRIFVGLGAQPTFLDQFRFLAGTSGDVEYITQHGHRLAVTDFLNDDDEQIVPASNLVDADGFTTGLGADGNPTTGDGYKLKVKVDTLETTEDDITGNVDADLPIRIFCGLKSSALQLPADVLLQASRFWAAKESQPLQGATNPVLTLAGVTPSIGPAGAMGLTGDKGIGINPGSATVEVSLDALINGVGFTPAGALTLVQGPFMTITPDAGANQITLSTDPGVATLNGRPAVGNDFQVRSKDSNILVTSGAGLLELQLNVKDATDVSKGLMTTDQASALKELDTFAVTRKHKHDGCDVVMGPTVSPANGIFDFNANTPVTEMIQLINDYLQTQAPAPTVSSLHGKLLTEVSGIAFGTGIIPSDLDESPEGINYSSPDYEAGDTTTRLNTNVVAGDVVLETTEFSDGHTGDVKVFVNGVQIDTVTLPGGDGTYVGAGGHISVLVNDIPGNPGVKQAKPTVTVPKATDLQLGHNLIKLRHEVVPVTDVRDTVGYEFYYDPATEVPAFSSFALSSSGSPYLNSGLPYMQAGDTLRVSFNYTDLIKNAFDPSPAKVEVNALGEQSISYTDPAVTSLSSPPGAEEAFTVTDYDTSVVVGTLDAAFTVNVTPVDPVTGDGTTVTRTEGTDMNVLWISEDDEAPALDMEDFITEDYRLDSGDWSDYEEIPTSGTPVDNIRLYGWDSGALVALQDLWGEATAGIGQVHQGLLQWPQGDYSALPTFPATTQNYTALAAGWTAAHYDRWFPSGSGHRELIVRLYGIVQDDLGFGYYNRAGSPTGKVNVEVKVPTQTVWLDCFASATGEYEADGDGCRTKAVSSGSDSYGSYVQLSITLGGATVKLGQGVVVRLTVRNTAIGITRVKMFNGTGGAY